MKVIWGGLGSMSHCMSIIEVNNKSEVTSSFFLANTTHDWKKLETWSWSHCDCLVTTHRLICSMICLAHHVVLTWGQMLAYTFQCHNDMFRCTSTMRTWWCPNHVTGFLSSKVICEIPCLPKPPLLTFRDLWGLIVDSTPKRPESGFKYAWELSIIFRFLYRYHGAKVLGIFHRILEIEKKYLMTPGWPPTLS